LLSIIFFIMMFSPFPVLVRYVSLGLLALTYFWLIVLSVGEYRERLLTPFNLFVRIGIMIALFYWISGQLPFV